MRTRAADSHLSHSWMVKRGRLRAGHLFTAARSSCSWRRCPCLPVRPPCFCFVTAVCRRAANVSVPRSVWCGRPPAPPLRLAVELVMGSGAIGAEDAVFPEIGVVGDIGIAVPIGPGQRQFGRVMVGGAIAGIGCRGALRLEKRRAGHADQPRPERDDTDDDNRPVDPPVGDGFHRHTC